MPANASSGGDAVGEPRQPVEQEVDLRLAALGDVRGGLAAQARELRRRDVREDPLGASTACSSPPSRHVTSRPSMPQHLGARADLRARGSRGVGERAAQRAHARRSAPPRPADDVPEEAAVLARPGRRRGREGADEAVGGDDAADERVGEALASVSPSGRSASSAHASPSSSAASRATAAARVSVGNSARRARVDSPPARARRRGRARRRAPRRTRACARTPGRASMSSPSA